MALYYPGLGYYTSAPDKIGKHGDYYTSPYLTNVFGNVVAKQLEEMWILTGKKDFTIVEYGAGMGSLCNDILDNFSVHKVIMKENDLKEIFVDYDNGFIEVLQPAHEDLKEYFTALAIELPNDFCAEVNLEAIEWIKRISSSLEKGFVLTIDYGYPSSELYQSYHKLGTIVCYNKHTVNDLPYNNIGLQDITAHVNFSALKFWGAKHGLENCGFTNQSQFLLGLGLTEHLRKLEEKEKDNFEVRKKLMLLHTLLMSMGKKFKVLIQQKGLNNPFLSGLQFCQPLI